MRKNLLNTTFRVEFDDPAWNRHLPSLKPLGLSVRLNTCNLATEEKYTDFFNYLVCESAREPLQRPGGDTIMPDLLPIPARGCLCELSFRIGFNPEVEAGWELEQLQGWLNDGTAERASIQSSSLQHEQHDLSSSFQEAAVCIDDDGALGTAGLTTTQVDMLVEYCHAHDSSGFGYLSLEIFSRLLSQVAPGAFPEAGQPLSLILKDLQGRILLPGSANSPEFVDFVSFAAPSNARNAL